MITRYKITSQSVKKFWVYYEDFNVNFWPFHWGKKWYHGGSDIYSYRGYDSFADAEAYVLERLEKERIRQSKEVDVQIYVV